MEKCTKNDEMCTTVYVFYIYILFYMTVYDFPRGRAERP